MRYTIEWTGESEATLNENIEYLSDEWDLFAINNFLDRVDEVVENIASNPKLYAVHRKQDKVHKCVVNKHITLYYRIVNTKRVDLLLFWNTHQDSKKLNV